MDTNRMMDSFWTKITDENQNSFDPVEVLSLMKNSQYKLTGMLHPKIFRDTLGYKQEGVTVTNGVLDLDDLEHSVLNGKQGVLQVKITGGKYFTLFDIDDVKGRTENSLKSGTLNAPKGYVFQNKLYVFPTTITSIDIDYIKQPSPLIYEVAYNAMPSPTTNSFIVPVQDGLVYTTDYYKDAVIYSLQHEKHFIVTAGTAGGSFTVTPSASSNFTTGNYFYFVSAPFDQTNLAGVEPDLDPSLHDLIVDLAVARAWEIDGQPERGKAVEASVINQINVLNAPFMEQR